MIKQSTIDEILNVAHIEEVVGDFVNLKKRGSNYIALCPFHNEKTPSFNVSPAKGIYKCFGCGKGGDAIRFLMEHEQLSYPEALRWLASKYNIVISEEEASAEELEKRDQRESLLVLNRFAAQFYSEKLWESEEGQRIGLHYFKERNFRESVIRKFGLGYAPASGKALSLEALEKGYRKEDLLKVGLSKEKDNELHDFFRERVVFPIHGLAGNVIAFGARTLSSDKKIPKYLNSPESEIYHKSKVLYGAAFAKSAIRKQDECFMVEGYTDVISLHQAGIENVVASSGTSLTHDQVRLVKRYTENISILYDGDKAGIAAALRGLDIVLEEGLNVKVVILPEGEDPDSFVQKEGASGFLDYVKKEKKDFILLKTELLREESQNDPVKKALLIRDIVSSIALIPDPIKRALYTRECAVKMEMREQLLINEVNKAIAKQLLERKKSDERSERQEQRAKEESEALQKHVSVPVDHTPEDKSRAADNYYQERDVLRVLIEYGNRKYDEDHSVAAYVVAQCSGYEFQNQAFAKIFEFYENAVAEGKDLEVDVLSRHRDEKVQQTVISILSISRDVSENWDRMHDIVVEEKDAIYRNDTHSAVTRLLLRQVRSEIEKNRKELMQEKDEERIMLLLHVRKVLKEQELELTARLNTVIY